MALGEGTVDITGYNTQFAAGHEVVWLEYDAYTLCSQEIEVLDATHMRATFDIPAALPSKKMYLRMYSGYGGMILSPIDVWIEDAETDASLVSSDCYAPIAIEDRASSFAFPNKNILNETIRNLNFHVPMWFAMIFLMSISLIASIVYLRTSDLRWDRAATASIEVGLIFATAGLATGATWARFTWGAWWTSDPQLNGAAFSTLIYLAYFSLRRSMDDVDKRARLAAVYAIFAFVMFYVFVKVIPGMADFSLHPDTTDNPSFKDYDVEDRLKIVFRLSATAWIALAYWIFSLRYRITRLEDKRYDL